MAGLATRREPLRVATRRSALAMAQSRAVGERLAASTGRELELVDVTTRGDVDRSPLTQIGGVGVFVAAVRQAVLAGEADVAVHSLKDLPTAADPMLRLAAVTRRADPRDALVAAGSRRLVDLPGGATVGTGSPRRRAQLSALRPDLVVVDLRGNVDTRIARVRGDASPAGDLDAVVLALAGLMRLGRQDVVTETLDADQFLPAPGQGALAVEVATRPHGGAAELDAALRTLDHGPTRAAVTAERALLAALEVGCSAPVGALARLDAEAAVLHLRAVVARPDGSLVRMDATGPVGEAERLGHGLADHLLARIGADRNDPPQTTTDGRPPLIDSHRAHRGSSE